MIEELVKDFLDEAKLSGKPPLIALMGPTASGKTALSLELARKFNGEIVSADSRQIYRHMDIGTDKISPEIRSEIKHYLIDIADPDQTLTLAQYQQRAFWSINDIHNKGKLPIFCGGTGLYINAVVDNYQIPRCEPNIELREALEKEAELNGKESVHGKLRELDPVAADRIHPNNLRYVIRAIEIKLHTKHHKSKGEPKFFTLKLAIDWDREILYDRINRRIDTMADNGLIDEVQNLIEMGYDPKLPSMTSLGYQEVIKYISGGMSLEEAIEEFKKNTRNFAKRQLTWFRRDKEINWLAGEAVQDYLRR